MKQIINLILLLLCIIASPAYAADILLQNIHVDLSFTYQPVEGHTLKGFRLYKDDIRVCEIQDSSATSMDCQFSSENGAFDFTMTAFLDDGSESLHSAPYTFALTSTIPATVIPLETVINSTPSIPSGVAPFTISLDGSQSTGHILSYSWTFGDGGTAGQNMVEHTYYAPGTYTATLTITDDTGATDHENYTITVTAPGTNQEAPAAVISSTATTGTNPLTVSFDASQSTAGSSPIASYSWSFGDGSSATGPTTNHTFTAEGTYTTILTVTDDLGQTAQTSTPVIVTESDNLSSDPQPPTAVLSANPTTGTSPLTVNFHGYSSADTDGEIISYSWNFGDGTTATGAAVQHTYTNVAEYTATLTVTDNDGMTSSASTTVSALASTAPAALNLELGAVEINTNWVRVTFDSTFQHPIVIAGPASFNGGDPCIIRLRNIDSTGFDIRLQEWDYLDGTHTKETVSYMVVEQGSFALDDGSRLEAGTFSGTMSFQTVNFQDTFSTAPVILTSVATFNETDTVTGQIKDVTTTGFNYKMREQEANPDVHLPETVCYIALEPGTRSIGGTTYEIGKTANTVTDLWYQINFNNQATDTPLFFASMQTTDGSDTAAIRYQNLLSSAVRIHVNEEQSKDNEITHTTEAVGYIIVSDTAKETTGQTATLHLEVGEVEIDTGWTRVQLNSTFQQPIVIAGPPSSEDKQPCVVRLRNIDSTGFDIRLQEWDYLDGTHPKETVSYLVMEQGTFTLDDGSRIEAGKLAGSMYFQTINFQSNFGSVPVLLASVATFNETDTVTGQIKNVSTTGFSYKLREQEANAASHIDETINFIAWQPGTGSLGDLNYEAAKTSNAVTDLWYQVNFSSQAANTPFFFATMQTTDGSDTAAIRYQELTTTSVQVEIDEEQSKDTETSHTDEKIGYVMFTPSSSNQTASEESQNNFYLVGTERDNMPPTDGVGIITWHGAISQTTDKEGYTLQAYDIPDVAGASIEFQATENINFTKGSLSFWFRTDTAAVEHTRTFIGATNWADFSLYYTNGVAAFRIGDSTAFFNYALDKIYNGEWHHINLSWDETTGQRIITVDDKTNVNDTGFNATPVAGALFLGNSVSGSSPVAGTIEQLTITNN